MDQVTGCETIPAVQGNPRDVKRICVELEDEDALGRLFDMDVLDPDGSKLDRESFGHPPRPCLVYGKAGKGCASRRLRRSVGDYLILLFCEEKTKQEGGAAPEGF